MRKIIILSFLVLGLVFVTKPVGAVSYTYPSDIFTTFYTTSNLGSPANEKLWAEGLLGFSISFSNGTGDDSKQQIAGDNKYLDGYDPGFSWDYVFVKTGNAGYLFQDQGDNLVTVPGTGANLSGVPGITWVGDGWEFAAGYGISHLTFFGGTTMVPEPTTLLLLGLGLIGAVGIRKKLMG